MRGYLSATGFGLLGSFPALALRVGEQNDGLIPVMSDTSKSTLKLRITLLITHNFPNIILYFVITMS
jgi:hypothetical protein